MPVPAQPKIYHIVHVDRLPSILATGGLLCDAQVIAQQAAGTTIGMNNIKQRRLHTSLNSYPDLHVGQCVPFYFCPRSTMLYVIHRADNDALAYRGGQGPIVHLQADLMACIQWAQQQRRRWVFTLSNAGSVFFEDRNNLAQLHELDWSAIDALQWQGCKEGKQAEFLMECCFPWHLIEMIGVSSQPIYNQVVHMLQPMQHKPHVMIKPDWYY